LRDTEENGLVVLDLSTALPQVKELGVVMYNCSCLARDLTKIFEAYWFLGQAGSSIPSTWPRPYDTRYNQETPMEICLNGTPALAYLAVSLREAGWSHAITHSLPLALPDDGWEGCPDRWSSGPVRSLGSVSASLDLRFIWKMST
jgi:hypothetical protein